MPNWNSNAVSIGAPEAEVSEFIARDDEGNSQFNMHKLFPERFEENDPCGIDTWDYDWAVENTGSKWFPELSIEGAGEETSLFYDSAWAPNNGTLLRLSEKSGWLIENEYEEPGMCLEGRFRCQGWEILLNECGEYRPYCDICEEKHDYQEMVHDDDNCTSICKSCITQHEEES